MPDRLIVLPRPGDAASSAGETPRIIAAPSEASFVATFGSLLPAASYLQTSRGKVAYYELHPASPRSPDKTAQVSRVLFVHGIQTPAIGLQPLASTLASRFPHAHVVLFDAWGHGLTDTPFLPHDPALFHWLLKELLGRLGWEDAHFVGYSFGAVTVASFAAAKPNRVASMVLAAPSGFISSAQFTETQRSYLRGGEGLEEQAQAWTIEFLEGGQLVVPTDWKERVSRGELVAEAVKDWELKNHEGHAASLVAILRDGGPLDSHAEFAKAAQTGIRSFCILGELDKVNNVRDLEDAGLENFAVVPGAGHAVVRTNVPEVAQLIEDFWGKF